MIVKEIAVLQQPIRPAPDDVQMLRLVGIKAINKRVSNPQRDERDDDHRDGRALDLRHRVRAFALRPCFCELHRGRKGRF